MTASQNSMTGLAIAAASLLALTGSTSASLVVIDEDFDAAPVPAAFGFAYSELGNASGTFQILPGAGVGGSDAMVGTGDAAAAAGEAFWGFQIGTNTAVDNPVVETDRSAYSVQFDGYNVGGIATDVLVAVDIRFQDAGFNDVVVLVSDSFSLGNAYSTKTLNLNTDFTISSGTFDPSLFSRANFSVKSAGAQSDFGFDDGNQIYVDNILITVPEPASLALMGSGALACLTRRRR